MFSYILTTIRANSTTPWYEKSPEVENHIQIYYRDPGYENSVIIESTDFVLKKEVNFISEEKYNDFLQDPIIKSYLTERRLYEEEHEITRLKEFVTS